MDSFPMLRREEVRKEAGRQAGRQAGSYDECGMMWKAALSSHGHLVYVL